MHLNLYYWNPYRDSEEWKKYTDGLDSDLSEDNLGGEAEEDLGQITGTPIKGNAEEKGELKTVRAAQRWFYGLQVIDQLKRDKEPLLQPVIPTTISLDWYVLGDSSKGGFGSVLSMPKEGSDGMEYGSGRVHAIHGICCE